MSMKCCRYIPIALVVLGILLGTVNVNQLCYAGGAVILIPAGDKDVPEGSFIPERRIKEIKKKVKVYKAKMKGRYKAQQQESLPKNQLPGPKHPEQQ